MALALSCWMDVAAFFLEVFLVTLQFLAVFGTGKSTTSGLSTPRDILNVVVFILMNETCTRTVFMLDRRRPPVAHEADIQGSVRRKVRTDRWRAGDETRVKGMLLSRCIWKSNREWRLTREGVVCG